MTRKEAIEVYNGLINEKIKAAFEFFAPELREGEDERIRKNIVATIEQCPDDFLNPKNRDRMLDWLEKQKEPKPAEWSEEDKDKIVRYLHDRIGGMLWAEATVITNDILDILRPNKGD